VVSVVAGMASADDVGRNRGLINQHIPAAFWADLKDRGLIRRDSPTLDGA
jgi:D-threo-aldose 1-dehydrogenase